MASRRTRIKGIANIPQRRKGGTEGENKIPVIGETGTKAEQSNTENEKIKTADVIVESDEKNSSTKPSNTLIDDDKIDKKQESFLQQEKIISAPENYFSTTKSTEEAEIKTEVTQSPESLPKVEKPVIRRKFIKPTIAVGTINRNRTSKTVQNLNDLPIETPESQKPSEKITILSNDVVQPVLEAKSVNSQSFPIEITLNETELKPEQPEHSDLFVDQGIRKLTSNRPSAPSTPVLGPVIQSTVIDGAESYPPPPVSPNKINRSRIKAVPRLNSQRKTSFSASESEDESKRTFYHPPINYRNRNDSVCSTTSAAGDAPSTECLSPQRPLKDPHPYLSSSVAPTSSTQKKSRRSEQSRKLANARMDFYVKFGHNKPDHQKLTMMDLIFYNPSSNPMSEGKKAAKSTENSQEVVGNVEDAADDQEDKEAESDEENAMPVPQIKIGPQGEIIIDEKSLVVENKETKRTRRQMERSKVIDGDFETGYGVYKRAKRSKYWSQNETLRFYKALNTIGTDFSLMCELFPKRSRRELKLKFKKEEKVNRYLIDKAIMQPRKFEFAELKSEVDVEEREIEELERISHIEEEEKKAREEQRKRKSSKNAEKPTPVETSNKKERNRQPKRRKLDIKSVIEDESDNEADVDSPDEDVEVITPPKPTRSGRVPKIVQKLSEDADLSEIDDFIEHSQLIDTDAIESKGNVTEKNVQSAECRRKVRNAKSAPSMEPGSIMVVPSEGNNGQVIKILMVTNNKKNGNKSEAAIENILTISATASGEDNEVVENNLTIPAETEHNVTIPAEENNITIPAETEHNVTIPAEENNITIPAETEHNVTIPAEENNITIPT